MKTDSPVQNSDDELDTDSKEEEEEEEEETGKDEDVLHYFNDNDEIHHCVKNLLCVSDVYSNLIVHHPNGKPYDLVDVFCGWGETVSCPSSYAASSALVKKRRAKTVIDFDQRRISKCLDDCPFNEDLRRDVVEPDTYRYIPNNGRYRLAKETRRMTGPRRTETNYTFMPRRPSVPVLNTEQRLLQRQMNRGLDRKADEVKDEDEDVDLAISGVHSETRTMEDPTDKKSAMKDRFHTLPLRTGIKDFRHKKETASQLQIAIPSSDKNAENGLLSKAFTDTIMKNFTSKISAMEEQIRGDANWWDMTNGGATHAERKSAKGSNSLRVQSAVRVLPVTRPALQIRAVQKVPTSKQQSNQPKAQLSLTGPHNTPRFGYLESYILNPLNLEAARPKQIRSDSQVKISYPKEKVVKRRYKEEVDYDETCGFLTAPRGKPNPRDRKADLVNEPDIITPSVALPELFGKKLEVTVLTHKWL